MYFAPFRPRAAVAGDHRHSLPCPGLFYLAPAGPKASTRVELQHPYDMPPDLSLKIRSQNGEFTNADFVQEVFLRTPGAAEMQSCVENYRRQDLRQVGLSVVPLCR